MGLYEKIDRLVLVTCCLRDFLYKDVPVGLRRNLSWGSDLAFLLWIVGKDMRIRLIELLLSGYPILCSIPMEVFIKAD